jgi:hypothetical protein
VQIRLEYGDERPDGTPEHLIYKTVIPWVPTPITGGMFDVFDTIGFELIRDQLECHPFKAEMIAPLDRSFDRGSPTSPTKQRRGNSVDKPPCGGLVIGWLITPPENYGPEITTANLERVIAVVAELGSLG